MKKEYRGSRFRGFIIGVLVLLLTLGLGFGGYAYWANNFKAVDPLDATTEITIGEAGEVETTISLDTNNQSEATKVLVPVGNVVDVNDVSDITFTFNVTWDAKAGAEFAEGDLTVVEKEFKLGGVVAAQSIRDLFTITITPDDTPITNGNTVAVIINLEFTNEPADQAEYLAVINKLIEVTFTFTVSPN